MMKTWHRPKIHEIYSKLKYNNTDISASVIVRLKADKKPKSVLGGKLALDQVLGLSKETVSPSCQMQNA